MRADVAELVDARDLKSLGLCPCGFDPRRPHQGLGARLPSTTATATGGPATAARNARPGFIVELRQQRSSAVNNIIYIIGLVVVVIAVLSFFGLR